MSMIWHLELYSENRESIVRNQQSSNNGDIEDNRILVV